MARETTQQIIINFPQTCTSEDLEHVLLKHYQASVRSATIVFNLNNVRWLDISCVSIVVLWISELREKGKVIRVKYPTVAAVSKFLDSYAVTNFLRASAIEILRPSNSEKRAVPSDLLRAPLYPLTFFSQDAFNALIADLRNPSRLKLVFGDLTSSEVISSGAIRDVIIYELMANIFDHGRGRFGHLIMTKTTAPRIPRFVSAQSAYGPLRNAETRFLSKLDGGDYIAIVIGDKGPGIGATLGESYASYRSSTKGLGEEFTECEVLDYSFQYSATRRSREERLARIKQALRSDLDIVPATGLFELREIVKQFSGYVQLRSGKAILCYDFLGRNIDDKKNPDEPVLSSCETLGLKRLTNFGGAQFKIYLPVNPSSRWRRRSDTPRFGSVTRSLRPHENPAQSYFSLTTVRDLGGAEDESAILIACQDRIAKLRSERENEPWIMMFDLEGYQGIAAKALHYLAYAVLEGQLTNELTLIVNAPKTLILSIAGERQRPSISLGRVAALMDEDREVYLLSRRGLVGTHSSSAESEAPFLQRWKAVVGQELEADELSSGVRNLALGLLLNGVRETIAALVYSPDYGVYDPAMRVRLPSDAFCEGFFDLTSLYKLAPFRILLAEWVGLWIQQVGATVLVTVGANISNILEGLHTRVRLVSLPTRRGSLVEVRSLLGLLTDDDKVILFTDVLGTGKTARAASAAMQNVRQLHVLAIVDASSADGDRETVSLAGSVVQGSVRYFPELPRGWDVSSIWEVDPRTRRLIRVSRDKSEPLWKRVSFIHKDGFKRAYRYNELFHGISVGSSILSTGHFVSNERHITYLFNIAAISQHYCDEIASVIGEDAEAAIASLSPGLAIRYVFFPSYNPGMELIARSIARLFTGSEVAPVAREELASGAPEIAVRDRSGAAIIVDDAFESGDTIFRLIDRVERLFFGAILTYPLIRRGSEETGRRFQKIASYGGAKLHLQFLSEASIPTFSAHDCPVCAHHSEWHRVEEKMGDCALVRDLAKRVQEELLPKSVAAISQEQLYLPLGEAETDHRVMGELRWRLEIARTSPSEKEYLTELLASSGEWEKNLLMRVLNRDRFIEGLPLSEKSDLFDAKLVGAILSHAQSVLKHPQIVPVDLIDDALNALLQLDIDLFNEGFRKLLSMALTFKPVDFAWIIAFGIRKMDKMAASMILQELLQIDKACPESDERREMIDEAVKLWRSRQDEMNVLLEDRVSVYKELIGGRLHEVSHLKEHLVACAHEVPVDIDALERSWGAMELEMRERIFPLLRKFFRSDMNDSLRSAFYPTFDALRYQLEEGRAVVNDLRNLRSGNSDQEFVDGLARRVGVIAIRAEDLVFGEKGIRTLLYSLRQDIHELVHSVSQQRMGDLEAKRIRVTFDLPEENCLVFGDDVALRLVMHILIDNIVEHSWANRLLMEASIDKDKGRVILALVDNGKGFKGPFPTGEGLQRAKRILAAYSASLHIKRSPATLGKRYTMAGFRAGIFIYFVGIPSRRKLR